MNREHIEDDLVSIVTRIMEDRLRYFRKYVGKIKKINTDGSVAIHSDEFGTEEFDTGSHIIAFPGNKMYSLFPPKKNDYVEFEFINGTPDVARYYGQSPIYHKAKSNWKDQAVIYYLDSTHNFLFDIQDNEFLLTNGVLPPEKMVKGETLKTQLESLITALDTLITQTAAITVPVISLGAPSGLPINAAAISAVSGTLNAIKATFSLWLSTGNKTN